MDWAFSIPSIMANEFRSEENGVISIYLAELLNLEVYDLDLKGMARLSKRQERLPIIEIQEPREASVKLVKAEKPNDARIGVFAALSRYIHRSGNTTAVIASQRTSPLSKSEWTIAVESQKYITHHGVAVTDATQSYGYRNGLISMAANKGILLSGTLLNNAFGPLERQLEQLRSGILRTAKEL